MDDQFQIKQLELYLDYLRSKKDLTNQNVILHNSPTWGICMTGSIRTKEKCPICYKTFQNVDNKILICKDHFTLPNRYFVDLYWNGKQRKIYSDSDGQILNNFELALRVLTEIRQKIKKHVFDPADYVRKRREVYQFDVYMRKWVLRYKEMYQRGEMAQGTWKTRHYDTEALFIPFFKRFDIREIRAGDIEDFYYTLPEAMEPSTKNLKMILLKTLFNYAKRRQDIKTVPLFPEIPTIEKKINWINEETQQKILVNISPKHRDIFLFMMRQGVRPGEARALEFEDIDRKKRTVIIHRAFSLNDYREFTKTRKIRILPLDDEVYKMLCSKKAIAGFVFTHHGKPYLSNDSLRYLWNKALKKAGLEHIRMYDGTRHSFASQAVNRGVPLNLIQDFLGHTTETTTRRYAHVDTNGLELVLNRAKIFKMKKRSK